MRTTGERMYTSYCYYSSILSGSSGQAKEEAIQADTARRYGFLNGLLHQGLLTREIYEAQKRRIPRQVALAYARFHREPPEKLSCFLDICPAYPSSAGRQWSKEGMIANFLMGYLDAQH